jgi:hypothetical protein
MISPSIEGPWEDVGEALPNGSKIQLDGVDNKNIWVRESSSKFKDAYSSRRLINANPEGSGPALRGWHILYVLCCV